jgi:hypothetical protein
MLDRSAAAHLRWKMKCQNDRLWNFSEDIDELIVAAGDPLCLRVWGNDDQILDI